MGKEKGLQNFTDSLKQNGYYSNELTILQYKLAAMIEYKLVVSEPAYKTVLQEAAAAGKK